jgi:hypothetical protein
MSPVPLKPAVRYIYAYLVYIQHRIYSSFRDVSENKFSVKCRFKGSASQE